MYMYVSCKVFLSEHLTISSHLRVLCSCGAGSHAEPRPPACFSPSPCYCSGLTLAKHCLAVWWSRLAKQSSWELAWDFGTTWMLLLERTTLPMQSVGSREPGQPSRWKAGQLGLIQEQPTSCLYPSYSESKELQRAPQVFGTPQIKCLEGHRAQNL